MTTTKFIKIPGKFVETTPQEFLPLAPELLAVGEIAMGALQESQRRANELARTTIIHTSHLADLMVRNEVGTKE